MQSDLITATDFVFLTGLFIFLTTPFWVVIALALT